MTQLKDKNVLLTGASRGLGPVIAETLAKKGANLALAARSTDDLQRVAASLERLGARTLALPVDLAQPAERSRLVETVLASFGTLDILINNAGIETEGAYLSLPWEALRQTVEVNLVAPMELTYLVLPHMLKRRAGHIVNIASIGARCGIAYDAAYCGTKAGLAEWARGLRLELAGTGIQFSTIFPSYVTEVGMFARFNRRAHWLVGSCTPAQVARAVLHAIERNQLDVIVNSHPLRLAFALAEVFPTLGDWLLHKTGVVEFQRRKVGANRQA